MTRIVIAGALALAVGIPSAGAQHSTPRPAVGTPPRHEGRRARDDRGRADEGDRRDMDDRRARTDGRNGRFGGTVVYLPADGVADLTTPYPPQQGIYYPQGGAYSVPGVYSGQLVNPGQGGYPGHDVYAPQPVYYPQGGSGTYGAGARPMAAASGGAGGYTPDLSGAPYVVLEDGVMLADLPSGERRSFPSCAAQKKSRDPSGKPRTVFYQPAEYGLVLREGQGGRVQGTPPSGTAACYAIDATGRVALLY